MKIRLLANYASPKLTAQCGSVVVIDDVEAKALIEGGYAEAVASIVVESDIKNFDEVKKEEIEETIEEEKTVEKAVNQTILRRKKAKKL